MQKEVNLPFNKSIANKSIAPLLNDILEVVEQASISCYDWIGKGDNHLADQAAVNSMRLSLNKMPISGRIVIGEGERDEAPMLYIGEKVGLYKENPNQSPFPEIDIALDPLEGTTICANSAPNSLAVCAFTTRGSFLHAPDVYMEKIAIGPNLPEGVIDLDNSVFNNLKNLALAKKCNISDLTAIILERSRHQELIAKVREAGARISLIGDGDIAGVISCTNKDANGDIYLGSGGAPEGVLGASALRIMGGQIFGRLIFNDDKKQIDRAKNMGISDINKQYDIFDMTGRKENNQIIFACSGVTNGDMVDGVIKCKNFIKVNSLIMNLEKKQIHNIETKFLI